MLVSINSATAVAVAGAAGQVVLRSFGSDPSQTQFTAIDDVATLPGGFVPVGISTSENLVSIYGGEWIATDGDQFERGLNGITVPDVAASETLQITASTSHDDVRRLQPAAYQYSYANAALTKVPSPAAPAGAQAFFVETVLPGAASIIGVVDDEDLASVNLTLALWGLDGNLPLGAVIGVASAVKDIVLPIGTGSLFAFVESSDGDGNTMVTPTLLGLVPIPLVSRVGTLVASSRTATSSVAVVEDSTGTPYRWAPLTGWTPMTSPSLGPAEYLVGSAGGAPDPIFIAATRADSFRVVAI